jgi:DNA repair exonuclease SbcCD ATPase subunit
MKRLVFLWVCVATLLVSCDGITGGSKKLQAKNDSLSIALAQRDAELDEMMSTFNDIQEGFRQINEAENRVDLQRGTISESAASIRQQIASDIEFITRTMSDNKAQIAKLQAQLKKSNTNSAQLKKAIDILQTELIEKTRRIEELQEELASKNIRIQELDAAVSNLSADKESLTAANEAKARTVAEQDKAINSAWFVFGTKSELKSQKILKSGDVLKSTDFNKDYFTQIDIRTTKEIKLYSKRADILTTHPVNTYLLEKDNKGQLTLKITNPTDFWSVSKYLVIQVR